MSYHTSGIQLKSVRHNTIRKTTQFDRYIGTAFMVLTALAFFLAIARIIIHH